MYKTIKRHEGGFDLGMWWGEQRHISGITPLIHGFKGILTSVKGDIVS